MHNAPSYSGVRCVLSMCLWDSPKPGTTLSPLPSTVCLALPGQVPVSPVQAIRLPLMTMSSPSSQTPLKTLNILTLWINTSASSLPRATCTRFWRTLASSLNGNCPSGLSAAFAFCALIQASAGVPGLPSCVAANSRRNDTIPTPTSSAQEPNNTDLNFIEDNGSAGPEQNRCHEAGPADRTARTWLRGGTLALSATRVVQAGAVPRHVNKARPYRQICGCLFPLDKA